MVHADANDPQFKKTKRCGSKTPTPTDDVRLDALADYPEKAPERRRFRYCSKLKTNTGARNAK